MSLPFEQVLRQLRHLAKEVLAVSTLELFPGTLLVDGEVDEIGFYYDFLFPEKLVSLFSQQELQHLEDHMHKLVYERRTVRNSEMMRENAMTFLDHLNQPLRVEKAGEQLENIVTLVQIGEFHDLCPPVEENLLEQLKAFKLLKFQAFSNGIIRIEGTAFDSKESLKGYLKQYKKALKTDPLVLGPRLGYFEILSSEEWIWLPKGEALLWKLTETWRTLHLQEKYSLIVSPHLSQSVHRQFLQKRSFKKVASLDPNTGDLASLYVSSEELLATLISSLQFFLEAFKIFPFEIVIYCQANRTGLLVRALEHLDLAFEEETRFKGEECVTFNTFDGYGRRVVLSSIKVEEKTGWVHHSLFYSLKSWMTLLIEMDRSEKI